MTWRGMRRVWEETTRDERKRILQDQYRDLRNLLNKFGEDAYARERIKRAMTEIDMALARYEENPQERDGDA